MSEKNLSKGVKLSLMIHSFIMSGFDEIDDFINFVKSALKREQEVASVRLEKVARDLNEEEFEHYYNFFGEDYLKIKEIFGKVAIELIIVKIYSYIEVSICELCDALREDRLKHNSETIEGRKNGYLDTTKKYLIKNLGLNLELDKNIEWAAIHGLKELRNSIVHNDGWLSIKNDAIRKLSQSGFIKINQEVELKNEVLVKVSVQFEYIDYVLPKVRKFFQDLKALIKQ